MAIPRKLPIDFGIAFPRGAYVVAEITPMRDYDRSTKEAVVQAVDPDTKLPIWAVDVIDTDPEAARSNRAISVKVAAKVMPVLDHSHDDGPFCPVEFQGLTATPYVEDNGNFTRIAWSFRASGVRAVASRSGAPAKAAS